MLIRSSHLLDDLRAAMPSGVVELQGDGGGFHEPSLDFLRDQVWIRRLVIVNVPTTDASGLGTLINLESLAFDGDIRPSLLKYIDLSVFPKLRALAIPWNRTVLMPKMGSNLEILSLSGYKPESKSISALPAYQSLRALSLYGGSLESLSGVASLKKLRILEVVQLRNLISIDPTCDGSGIEDLKLKRCGQLVDISGIERYGVLRSIVISQCKHVRTIRQAAGIKSLESLRVLFCPVPPEERELFSSLKDCIIAPRG